jgi:hypothetical protein
MAPAKRIPAALRAVVAAAPGIWKPASGIPAAAIQHQALTVNWCSALLGYHSVQSQERNLMSEVVQQLNAITESEQTAMSVLNQTHFYLHQQGQA